MPKKKQSGSVGVATTRELKLVPHLVPKPLWGKSAANLLKRSVWERIRRDALELAGQACQVCSDGSALIICHELWDYDDERGIAALEGLRIQCRNCDRAVHMGRTFKHAGREGYLAAIAQLRRVNGIGVSEAELLYRSAMDTWKQRSKMEWRIIVAKSLLERYPEL